VIEPDERFAPLLTAIAAEHQTELHLITAAFEEAQLPDSHFDLVVAATAFHWVDPATGLTKVAQVLKPGGYVALWWHVFGDPDRADPFHEATYPVLKSLSSSPGDKNTYLPFALDTEARRQDFARTGQFEEPTYTARKWTLILNPTQVAALYGTYSGINRLPTEPRQAVLDQLTTIAETEFNGRVTRNMVSPLYLARRR
jgi:SAM-dependent methyltransferase